MIYSLLGTAQLNGLNVEAYLRYVLERLPVNQVEELLPWHFAKSFSAAALPAAT